MDMILCIGGCLDGQRVEKQGEYIRWHAPRNMPTGITETAMYEPEVYADIDEYRLQRLVGGRWNTLVYVHVKIDGRDWIRMLLEAYMKRPDRHAPVAGSRVYREDSMRMGIRQQMHRDHRYDSLRYALEERDSPFVKPAVDKPVVDKKPTPPQAKIGKIDFSTTSDSPKTGKKLIK